jgi:transcriptional regulator with XRE-family HTH domain
MEQKKGFAQTRENYFGEALRDIRNRKTLTQIEAAKLLQVTQSLWSAYEVGKTRPTLDLIIMIARALNIEVRDFIKEILEKRDSMLAAKE